MRFILLSVLAISLTTTWANAQMDEGPDVSLLQDGAAKKQTEHPLEHPVLPRHAEWAGVTVIIVLAMFFAAAMVGIAVRANTAEELPDDSGHSHDEHHDAHGGQGH